MTTGAGGIGRRSVEWRALRTAGVDASDSVVFAGGGRNAFANSRRHRNASCITSCVTSETCAVRMPLASIWRVRP